MVGVGVGVGTGVGVGVGTGVGVGVGTGVGVGVAVAETWKPVLVSSNAVPPPLAPPAEVVPYRLPAASATNLA